jgi:uncharacterized protein
MHTDQTGDIAQTQSVTGGTSMASNVETTKRGYELFKQSDIPTLLKEIVDDNCIWIAPGAPDKLPWAGRFKGKQDVANFFKRVAETVEFIEFSPREMIEQGDSVAVIGRSTVRSKKTGKTVNDEWVHIFKYKQGRLVFFQEYTDTAALAAGMS